MEKYIALLRGVNISGKNKIPMDRLKQCFINAGFKDAKTYLNSGNVVFCSDADESALRALIQNMIQTHFSANIPVFVIAQSELKALLAKAPAWWGSDDKAVYDNLIFVLPPADAQKIAEKIGEPSEDLEQICIVNNAVFWSFDRAKYQKANWWKKTAAPGIGEDLTIRTANTCHRLAGM